MAFLEKDKNGYYRLYERKGGKKRYVKYIGKDPKPYLDEVARGREALAVKNEYPDLALKSASVAIQEHRRRKLPKLIKLPDETFDVIYADPPWQYENSGLGGSAENHYPTRSLEWIKSRNIKSISKPDSVLFLWATNPFLYDALDVMRTWGFDYKTNIVWVKNKSTYGKLGFYVFGKHEVLLIGITGSILPTGEKPVSVVETSTNGHSRKPEIFYEIIEGMYPGTKKVELFCRLPREGWVTWGNEV